MKLEIVNQPTHSLAENEHGIFPEVQVVWTDENGNHGALFMRASCTEDNPEFFKHLKEGFILEL